MRIKLNNKLFEYIATEKFKITVNSIIKNLTIIITHLVQVILNEDEARHCGQKDYKSKLDLNVIGQKCQIIFDYVRTCHQS